MLVILSATPGSGATRLSGLENQGKPQDVPQQLEQGQQRELQNVLSMHEPTRAQQGAGHCAGQVQLSGSDFNHMRIVYA